MKKIRCTLLALLIGMLCSALAIGAPTITKRLIEKEDIDLTQDDNAAAETVSVTTSTGGTMTLTRPSGGMFPWDNSYTRTIRPKNITGDNTGNITGFDNLTVTGRVTTATLTVTGTPIFTDNTINGSKLIDNTLALGKIAASGTKDSTTYLRGDGAWTKPLPAVCNLSKSATQSLTGGNAASVVWQTEDSDVIGAHSSADNTLIVVPTGYTWANFYVAVYFNATATVGSWRKLILYNTIPAIASQTASATANFDQTIMLVTGWIPVTAGDNVFVTAYSSDNSVINKDYSYFRAEFK
jgi:hypothetical protein